MVGGSGNDRFVVFFLQVAKLVLDDYFSSNEFLASVEMGSSFDLPSSLASPVTPMAGQHQLITGSPFVDSGVGLDAMAIGGGGGNCIEVDDDVFIVDPPTLTSSSSSNSTLVTSTPSSASNNGLSRSRRSHFSRKDSAPEGIKDGSRDDSTPGKGQELILGGVLQYLVSLFRSENRP